MSRPSRPAPERRRDGPVCIYAAPGTGSTDAAGVAPARAGGVLARPPDGRDPAGSRPASGWTRRPSTRSPSTPARYGFHGTLKAPFRLAEGRSIEQLEQDLERFRRDQLPRRAPATELAPHRWLLRPRTGADAPDLHELAAALVTGFDAYRAPATVAETARRNPDALTPRRRRMLEAWGYPYVLDEFRFI